MTEPSDTPAETERFLRDRIEELEVSISVLHAELRVAQQELWSHQK